MRPDWLNLVQLVTRPGNQILVWNDDIGPVKGLDAGRTDRDGFDNALHCPDLDPVAFGDRAFDQQDDAGHEIRHDGLKAETDANRQGTGNDGQTRQVDPRWR